MICVYDKIVNNYHAISGTVQTGYYQLGNVKLLQRPKVPEEVMMAAGWEDATGTATVFSVAYSAGDEEVPWGQKIIVHITPIRHDGTVLTENQLDAYFDSLIEETTISAMLAADNAADKLILWVQEVPGTWDDAWERADLFDDLLHRLQAVYYLNEFSEMPTNEELQEFNPAISVNIVIPDYTTNGDAVLCPKECKIKNIAGGNYELTMVHPIDTLGKWKHLQPGAVIRAPIPEEEIENAFAGYEADVYKTIEKADLRELPSEPVAISYPSWSIGANYSVGAKVSWNNKNWKCNYFDETSAYANIAPGSCAWWSEIARKTSGSEALVTLKKGEDLYYIEDADTDWYKMSTYYGIVGYIRKNQVVYDRHLTPSETKPRIIKTQLFRIEKPTVDTKARTVTIKAKHVSYDLNGVLVKDVSIGQASPAMALGRITEGFMMDYPGTIATNLKSDENGTYTNDIKGKNGTFCLLDPDKGIVSTFRAAYKRDNWDLFIMKQTNPDRGFRITYRKNQLGVNWDQDSSGIITRVVPVAKDEAGENLYLPEVWIDSPRINQYPVIKMERLTVKGQVGKPKSEEDETTWTLADLYQEMREKAGERFSVDKADQVTVTVTVDFEQLGDTEEHRELKGLEKILLYDTVTVENEEIGLSVPLYVSEWEWDAIREKILAVKLVNALDYNKGSVSGYNVQSKSIGSEKLADDVAEGIVTQVVSVMPEYADPNAKRPSSDVVPNTVSADGIVTKGQGQLNKTWQTDNQGNPAWRDATTSGLYNIGTVDSTGTLSSIQAAITAFGNARKNNNNTTGQFNISYSNPPSDLPSQAMEWEYAEGYITARYIDANGMIGTGDVVLLSYNTGKIAKASIYNGTLMSWGVINSGTFIPASQKGAASGVAELDSAGKVPAAQLPSYVDDVLEYASRSAFPATGQTGKIYVAIDTGKTYRWSGSEYIELSTTTVTDSDPTLAWGTRSKVGSVQGTDLHVTLPGDTATQSAKGLMSSDDKTKLDEMSGFFNLGTVDTATSLSSLAKAVEKLGNLHKSHNNVVGVVNWSYSNIPADLPDTTDQNWVYGNGMIIARYIGSGGTVDNGEFVIFGYGGKIAKSAIYNNSIVSWTIHDPDLKLDKSQGSANAGKNLYVGSNGDIALGNVIELGTISDLFVSNLVAGTTYHFCYGNNTTNAPNTDGGQGYIFTHPSSASWGCVIAYTPTMQWLCPIQNGAYKTWKATITTVSNSLTDTSTTNALSAAKGKELYDQIAKNNRLSYNSLADLKTGILSIVSSMGQGEKRAITIYPNFTGEIFVSGTTLTGFLQITSNNTYFNIDLMDSYGKYYSIGYRTGTWYFNSISNQVNGLLKADGTAVLYNVDANDYKNPGTYFFVTGCSNVPADYFLCTVIMHPSDFYIQIGASAGNPKLLYKRSWQNGSWGAWQPMRGIFEDTYSGTTNGYGFVISNVSTNRKLLTAYSNQGPVFYWADSGVWVFGLINITQDTSMNRKPNQAMTVYYKYYT